MLNAMSLAADAIFADPNTAEDALWDSPLGPVMVRVIRHRPDEVADLYGARGVVPTLRINARAGQMTPEPGQTLEIDGTLYRIVGAPMRDALNLIWTFEAVDVSL